MSEAVTPTKPTSKDKPAKTPEPADAKAGDVVKDTNAAPDSNKGAKPATPAPAPKKPIGVKEVIAFEWKLVGLSCGVRVTLFKAVERPDVEAQLGRLRKDGYYKELEILDNDAKVTQPKSATTKKAVKAKATLAKKKKTSETTSKAAKAKKKPAPARKVKTASKAPAKTASKPPAKTVAKPAAKIAPKAAAKAKKKTKTKAKTAARKSRKK